MRIAIVHLSDIHLAGTSNVVLNRLPLLCAALRSALVGIDASIVAVTGDITRTGASDEYEAAERFFANLSRWFAEELKLSSFRIVLVPGNHDCSFHQPTELRTLVLEKIHDYVDTLDTSSDIAAACLSVQGGFFAFEARVTGRSAPLPVGEQLHYRVLCPMDDLVIRFECLNTAWLSQKQEAQGALRYPIGAITAYESPSSSDVVVSLFHHPYAWLQASNRREFQQYIERTSDVVLTGHEHDTEYYRKETQLGDQVQYIEGAALQGNDPLQSGFNVVLLDLDALQQTALKYEWRVDRYDRTLELGPRAFVRNRQLRVGAFENCPGYVRKLIDPGRGFNHPTKKQLQLSDIFVYPDARRRSFDELLTDIKQEPRLIKGEGLLPHIASKKLILVTAERDAGKTSLAKMLYVDLQRLHSLVPLMISGESVDSPKSLDRAIDRAVTEQYAEGLLEPFRQLPPDKRVLILDDFHLLRMNRKAQRQLVSDCRERFGSIIAFADDLFSFEELAVEQARGLNPFVDFDHCELRPFGHVLRHRLIRKWVTLGREQVLDEKAIACETAAKENVVNALIGKNVIPPLPVLILIILQAAEAARGAEIVSGAYGYFYEVLITEALSSVTSDITETGSRYTYLSRLAHFMFERGHEVIEDSEIEEVTARYAEEYRASVDHTALVDQLLRSQVIQRINGSLGFRYRYYYFYFVAYFLKDALADPEQATAIRTQLYDLADHVFYEPNANVLVFYLYLTKDIELIQYLLRSARTVFDEYRPAALEEDIDHLNELFFAPPKRELSAAGEETNREEYLGDLDGPPDDYPDARTCPERVAYHAELELSLKFNIAFKMLQLLGQILKNFPGSLKGELKLEIARECYRLGLRVLAAFLTLSKGEFDTIKAFIEELLRDRLRLNPEERNLPSAEHVILGMSLAAAFGVIKRVSYAVGHEQLKLTYSDVVKAEGAKLSVSLIDVSIKLDHFPSSIPRSQIEDLQKRSRKNTFCYTLLQDLVYQFLYLFPTTFAERQSLGKLVGIKVSDPRLYEIRSKQMLPLPKS